MLVGIIILAALVAIFFIFTALKLKAGNNLFKYPTRTNCEAIGSLFTVADGTINESEYLKFALNDKDATLNKMGAGYYQCYCKKYSSTLDATKKDKPCHQYQIDKYWGLALTNTVTVLISVMNIVLRMLVQFLVDKIGYHTDSERLSVIMVVSFFSAFLFSASTRITSS